MINGTKAVAKLYVTEDVGNRHIFYLTKIETISADSRGLSKRVVPNSSADIADCSIAQLFDFVKNYNDRFEADSDKLRKAVRDFFNWVLSLFGKNTPSQ